MKHRKHDQAPFETKTGAAEGKPDETVTAAGEAPNETEPADEAAEHAEPQGETAEPADEAKGGQPEENAEPKPEEKKEEEDLRTQYLRLAADFQNFRKRTEKEKGDIYARANESLMTDLLPVLDDFERALAVKDEAAKGVQDGVRMIVDKYVAALKKHGLFEIEALGAEFDPNFHHAVQTCPAENGNEGKVAVVLQKGYLLNGKVIRPAMVIVAE